MLTRLHISNYALISRLDIDFCGGFSVITGETGAGKSILLGALGLIMGKRADSKAVKADATKCVVEAAFSVEDEHLHAFFQENDIDFDGEECIVRREVTATGKSRAFVNDTPVQLTTLKTLSNYLADIHSQHQNLLVAREDFLLDTLDGFSSDHVVAEAYKAAYEAWRNLAAELKALKAQTDRDTAEEEFLLFQYKQFEDAALTDGEQEELEEESERLNHVEEIKQAMYDVVSQLTGEGDNVLSRLRNSQRSLEAVTRVFPQAEDLENRLQSAILELDDIASEADRHFESLEFDPERLMHVEERLNVIYTLQKKHHVNTIADLLDIAARIKDQLARITHADEDIERMEQELNVRYDAMIQAARTLSEKRRQSARAIEGEMLTLVAEMGMPNAQMTFRFEEKKPDASGTDHVVFLFSANRNVPMQNAADIASGGEISRLMLALKSVVSKCKQLPTVIFDEIDTGVSGTLAERMALVMRSMADRCQVICITHLPQIAARGDHHLRVYKEEDEVGTTSHIVPLSPEERITEIANMLSGEMVTEAAVNNAKALLNVD